MHVLGSIEQTALKVKLLGPLLMVKSDRFLRERESWGVQVFERLISKRFYLSPKGRHLGADPTVSELYTGSVKYVHWSTSMEMKQMCSLLLGL